MRYSLLVCFTGFILNSCLHFERRQVSEEQGLEKSPMGGAELVAGEEPVGGEEPIAVEDPTTGITWITIPTGSFMMGSSLELSEQPIHPVTVQAFQMSETEVTVAQYRRCVEAGRCSELTSCEYQGDLNWTAMPNDKENHPINCINWGQARDFALWAGGDLPTEAQWEYAARGGENYIYAGSNNADDVAWYASNSERGTRPVKTKIANGYGLYDISGNVYEWTLDEWHINYESAPSQAETPWGNIFPVSQTYDNEESKRIVRGGAWYNEPLNIRVTHRNDGLLAINLSSVGFRVRRTLR